MLLTLRYSRRFSSRRAQHIAYDGLQLAQRPAGPRHCAEDIKLWIAIIVAPIAKDDHGRMLPQGELPNDNTAHPEARTVPTGAILPARRGHIVAPGGAGLSPPFGRWPLIGASDRRQAEMGISISRSRLFRRSSSEGLKGCDRIGTLQLF